MNKSESKYFRTARRMDEALIALLEKKDPDYISVKELCETAGVNRSTFYLHYETIADLIRETAEAVNRRFLSCFQESSLTFTDEISAKNPAELILITHEYLCPYLRFIRENKQIYRATFRNPGHMQAVEKYKFLKSQLIEPILSRFDIPEAVWKYYIAYYIEGIMAVVKEWLAGDCADPVETVASVIEACVVPSGNPMKPPPKP